MKGKRTGLHKKELYEEILHYANYIDESNDEIKLKDLVNDYRDSFKTNEGD